MRRRTALGLAALALAVAGAAMLALLAADVLAWRGHLEEADVRLATSPRAAELEPETRLPAGLSRRLLGVDDDIEFREAVRLFRNANVGRPARDLREVGLRSRAETALARVGRTDPSPARRSLAATLRGIFSFEEARDNEAQRVVFLRRSLADFREAIRLDATNEDAKYDLELALRLLENAQQEAEGGGGGQRGDPRASGAGAASSGSGY
ncbi:MAG: hypothetical protein ACRDN6_10460 [Gaiellaceae bacterium]